MSKEGRRIKTLDPMNYIIPFFMPDRNGATNYFKTTIDITEAENYLRKERIAGRSNINLMHVIMTAYVRTVAQLPGINRYIRGQRIYARNDIAISLTIKKKMQLDAQETVVKLFTQPDDTLGGIYNKVNALIEENKVAGDSNGMDVLIRALIHIPRIILKFVVWLLKTVDYFGLLPKCITNLSPFHGSMYITNLGSLGIDPVYHHLYNFGNIPIFFAMGKKKNKYILDENGNVECRKIITITVSADERICDGHYYAEAFKRIKRLIEKPWLLEEPPEKVVNDIK